MKSYPAASHLVIGDFNFECLAGNPGFNLFHQTVSAYDLICCDNLNQTDLNYTYVHESLNQYSWLDHIFITKNLQQNITFFEIIDHGANCSDHLPISCTLSVLLAETDFNECPIKSTYRQRWDKADLVSYYYNTGHLLQSIVVPAELLHCSTCVCPIHKTAINDYYQSIISVLQNVGESCVPKMPYKCLKAYWNDELNRLKEISIDMHNLWRKCGSPKQGVINSARIKAKLTYKEAIKKTAADFERANADEINRYLETKDYKCFWKCWNSKYQKRPNAPATIANHSDSLNIANAFKDYFANIYTNSSDDIQAVNEFNNCNVKFNGSNSCVPDINIECIERCLNSLKRNKAAGCDGLVAEHILNSHPSTNCTYKATVYHDVKSCICTRGLWYRYYYPSH